MRLPLRCGTPSVSAPTASMSCHGWRRVEGAGSVSPHAGGSAAARELPNMRPKFGGGKGLTNAR
eukprot:scaffold12045_cov63-Phaeocystis_antarctica.AAC.3